MISVSDEMAQVSWGDDSPLRSRSSPFAQAAERPAASSLERPLTRADDESEDAGALGFDSALRDLVALRGEEFNRGEFAQQIIETNQRALSNQRITEDDLRVMDDALDRGVGRSDAEPGDTKRSATKSSPVETAKGGSLALNRPAPVETEQSAQFQGTRLIQDSEGPRSEGAGDRSSMQSRRDDEIEIERAMRDRHQALQRASSRATGQSSVTPFGLSRHAASKTEPAAAVQLAKAEKMTKSGKERVPTNPALVARGRLRPATQSHTQANEANSQNNTDLSGSKQRVGFDKAIDKTGTAESLPKDVRIKVLRDLGQALRSHSNERHLVIRMQLSPPELGRLTIDMRMDVDTLKIKIEADNDQIRELLRSTSGALSKVLQEQGISVERFEVVTKDAEAQAGSFEEELDAHGAPDEPADHGPEERELDADQDRAWAANHERPTALDQEFDVASEARLDILI